MVNNSLEHLSEHENQVTELSLNSIYSFKGYDSGIYYIIMWMKSSFV
jgi:hypothetical protein